MTAYSSHRLAVDIGGTFTDVVLENGNDLVTAKVLTTSSAPEQGVVRGIQDVLSEAGIMAKDISMFLHGTTLATNAIIERKGATTALITTAGFRDVIEIGYESRYNQYDILIDKPAPLVPRELRFTVPERVDIHGRVLWELDEKAVKDLIPKVVQAGVESVAIGFLHGYANPQHERRVEEIIGEMLPDLSITLSAEVCPEIREFERLTTATANAYVRPLMSRYLDNLKFRLEEIGLQCPVLLMTSGGGLTTLDTASKFPIRLVESGPAGGAILASGISADLNLHKVISFDMGGTTAKICLIDEFEAQRAREFEVGRQARFFKGSGLPLRIPVIEMVEIGAGGGSIARVDGLNQITIGPDSAGAEPGPAAYGRGGGRPTITDADIHLGRIDLERFAGGKVELKPDLAASALRSDIGDKLELPSLMAAYGVTEM
ncbi:MAG TPA: methylhydantoinase, partial [Gammaproteobacteria bacterium]|nr:methylhydantoinase [Gammaproteobacteria bacterium]